MGSKSVLVMTLLAVMFVAGSAHANRKEKVAFGLTLGAVFVALSVASGVLIDSLPPGADGQPRLASFGFGKSESPRQSIVLVNMEPGRMARTSNLVIHDTAKAPLPPHKRERRR